MSNQSIVIDISENVYEKYKRRAEQTHSTVEDEIKAAIAKDVIEEEEENEDEEEEERLSPELQKLVDQLPFLDEIGLNRLAKSTFPKKDASKIESLHHKQQSDGLTEQETQTLDELMNKLSRWFVLRNEAMGLLFRMGKFNPKSIS